ncbi:two-component hybrid sensor and regulator [Halarchaeum acidiphilum MH1-52-1]|uniref:Two-component hybrid sensor and regulator n=1 Tax=Halarchaeum acidiphilum MH1-52-1 TaxID=1261545 RepID=U2YRV3_9EURY|nr:PAS domain-containing protein [Halarchaeum acidiphilum]GAD51457.1 two-component hybrid sensor and regulator [Halarchaeum acidiphilum MH1-52-1]
MTAPDGASVVDSLSEHSVDCIACEDRLTGIDAIGVLRLVRDTDPAIPFVLYALDGSESLAADAISAGVTDYVRADGDDGLDRLIETLVSASRRYRAEQDVALLNDLARNVYERITEAFFALDREWRFTYINQEAENLLEVTAERIVGENIWEVFPESVGSTFYTEFHRAIATQDPVTFEESFGLLDKHFEVRAYPSEDGLSIHFRQTVAGESTRGDHLMELTSLLSYDLADSIDNARAALTATRASHPEVDGLDDVEAALDRMDDLVNHSVTLASEENYSTTNSTG